MDATLLRDATAPFDGPGAASTSWLDADAPALTGIDAHAHVFVQGLSLATQRRYVPDYDATLDDYVTRLSAHGLSQGVLVQPSFLGTDNSFLAAVTKRYPQRFRGVAVVEPQVSEAELTALADANVVGIRLNLFGVPLPDLNGDAWTRLLARVNALRWHVEVHSPAATLPVVLGALLAHGCTVVVDHFGRPDPALGERDAGFQHLLSTASTGNVWVKLSAAYRCTPEGEGIERGAALTAALLDAFGPARLMWGSDWPHTQYRQTIDYAKARHALQSWVPDDSVRQAILTRSPAGLFRF